MKDITILLILWGTVIFLTLFSLTFLTGCSLVMCECNTKKEHDRLVDRNSTNIEFNLTPKTH